MAATSLIPAERFWADQVQQVSNSAPIIVTPLTPSKPHSDFMVYNTGSRDDWDYISRITEDPAWTWDAMAPYRDLNQKYVPPNDGHDDVSQKHIPSRFPILIYHSSQTNQYLPSAHSRNGMISISLPGFTWPIDSRVVAATTESAFAPDFPFQRDMNTGNPVCVITVVLRDFLSINFCLGKQIGFGWVQATVGNGQRSGPATTYIGPDYENRPNLHILLRAQATKLVETTGLNTTAPRFNRVEFGTEPSGELIKPQSHECFCL